MSVESLRVSVEIAHPTPNDSNLLSANAGLALVEVLDELGHEPEAIIFVDDIVSSQRPKGKFWQAVARTLGDNTGVEIDEQGLKYSFLQESDMIARGHELVNIILNCADEEPEARSSQDDRFLILGNGKQRERIKLMGYREYADLPSCEVMDLACYEHKLSEAVVTVTVISEDYREQQDRVRNLAKFLGYRMPVLLIYVGEQGEVVAQDSWLNDRQPYPN